jgi:PAS domain S-box-containing protein
MWWGLSSRSRDPIMTESAAASVRSCSCPAEELSAGVSPSLFHPLFENLPLATALLDMEGRVVRANPELTRIFGFAVDDLLGRVLDDLVVPDSLRAEATALGRRIHRGDPVALETVRCRRDGTLVDVAVSGIPVQIADRILGSYAIFRDITPQKRMEAERDELLAEVRRVHASTLAAGQRRAKLIASATHLLSVPAQPEMLLKRLARMLVPDLADSCIVYLRTSGGSVRRLEVVFHEVAQETLLRKQLSHYPPDLERLIPPVARVLVSGEPQLIPELSIAALKAVPGDSEHVSVALVVGLSSLLVVPIQAGDRTLGAISLGLADSGRSFDGDDLALAEEIAGQAASLLAGRLE